MIINTNVQALKANNALWSSNNKLIKASTNLSTGTKINKAGDDPTGMALSNKMKMQIKGLETADRNTNDAISLIQTAEGGVAEMQSITQRLRELAVQAGSDTLTKDDRELIQTEADTLIEEIDAITDKIEFNKKALLNDDYEKLTFQVGGYEGQELELSLESITAGKLGISGQDELVFDTAGNPVIDPGTGTQKIIKAMDYTTVEGALNALDRCDNALNIISEYRTNLGAVQTRLEKNINSLAISEENTRASLSRVLDTDMAEEMADYTKNNVLVQSGIAMLSQANQRPNQLLSLLQ